MAREPQGAVWVAAWWSEGRQRWYGGYWHPVSNPGPLDFTREQQARLQLMRQSVERWSRYADDLAPAAPLLPPPSL